MPIEPVIAAFLARQPPGEQPSDVAAFRAGLTESDAATMAVSEPGPEVRSRTRVSIPVSGGAVDALVYTPEGDGPHPVHLFFHGGGWVGGTIHSSAVDVTCRERSVGAGCVVVAVDYRKAPEHPYPTALNDCRASLDWVVANAVDLGVRVDLVTVGGQSAGANLAAALTLQVRDTKGPDISFQLLEVPSLDATLGSPSQKELAMGYGITRSDIEWYLGLYLTEQEQTRDPYVSPLLAGDLSGLPPAHVMAAEYDPLRDDAFRYVARLQAAGVPAAFTLLEGHVHFSSGATRVLASARAWRAQMLDSLAAAHCMRT